MVRVSGAAAGAIRDALAGPLKPRRATLKGLRHPETGEVIDRGLALWFPGPASYTGEDVLELHVHGGRAVLDDLFTVLGRFPRTRMAEPGEYSRRAFLNGRLDLTAAEGIADLVAAETSAQRRQALRQAGGALAELYDGWRTHLLHLLAHMEAWLDFPDEEIPDDTVQEIEAGIADLEAEIGRHLADARRGERLRDGVAVAIVGPPNAGKSSLLNALAVRDVAIVSDIPGTTRDALEVHLDLGGWPVVLIDTAGLRESGDAIEQEGVRRARARAAAADIVLALRAVNQPADAWRLADQAGSDVGSDARLIRVLTKTDLSMAGEIRDVPSSAIRLSVRTGDGMAALLERLTKAAAELIEAGGRSLPTRMRHRDNLAACRAALGAARAGDWSAPELIGEDLRQAMQALGRLTGRVDVEDLLDVIFRDFCIGK